MVKIRAYLSHSIRGPKGATATAEEMAANCRKAITFAIDLRILFPELEIYCPAEGDEFVTEAYFAKILTEDEILTVDCTLLSRRDVLFVDVREGIISKGMKIEIEYAQKHSIPVLLLFDMKQTLCVISDFLEKKLR